ncbi:hypothetical protein LSH36_208g03053 [Paralvinella palmiformis]|uniref:Uncharacterized protein n=1 Tax=Paralvinella palmiformis TaxID=53620 RepID=A0AAD9JP34_9ANNE|nr:hypothetical protein LSH36_208g03053 [Paralvinella palmiformis]
MLGYAKGLFQCEHIFQKEPVSILKPYFFMYWLTKNIELLDTVFMLTAVDEVSFGRQCERERTEKGVAYQCEMKVKKRSEFQRRIGLGDHKPVGTKASSLVDSRASVQFKAVKCCMRAKDNSDNVDFHMLTSFRKQEAMKANNPIYGQEAMMRDQFEYNSTSKKMTQKSKGSYASVPKVTQRTQESSQA